MKKVLCFCGSAIAAFAASAAFDFKPDTVLTAYDWNSPQWWYSGGKVANRTPTSSDETWLTNSKLRNNGPLCINTGTAAEVKALYLANNAVNAKPVQLVIDGGSLTAYGVAYLGQQSCGSLTIKNGGSFLGKTTTWIGTANTTTNGLKKFNAKVTVADASSSFKVNGGVTYVGNQAGGNSTLENHGSVDFTSSIYLGYSTARRDLGEIVSVVDNYGTMTATVNNSYYLGSTYGQTGIITNHAGATISGAKIISVGSAPNSIGRLVNDGTIDVARVTLGGDTYSSYALAIEDGAFANGYALNRGTITASGFFRVGWQTNGVGRLENVGNINCQSEFIVGYCKGSTGYFRHSAGKFDFQKNSPLFIGYNGKGYMELAGDTATDLSKAKFSIMSDGELVITNSASLTMGYTNFLAAASNGYKARVALYDNAKLGDIGQMNVGNIKTDNYFEMFGNSSVSNVNQLVLDVGNKSSGVTGSTTMRLKDNATFTGVKSAYIGNGKYNNATLEVADNAFFALSDDAWEGGTNDICVATDTSRLGSGTIRLRGGMIGLGIRGGLNLGDNNDANNAKSPAKLVGYGVITNQGNSSKTYWSRINIRAGSATADGEGVERDLNLRTFARISASVGEGRDYLNKTGSNGWFAVNKGRLLYPARDSGDKGVSRFIGDYARMDATINPRYSNSMRLIVKGADGSELTANRRYHAELYAPDRTDIPAGLAEDGSGCRRLGVWRCGISKTLPYPPQVEDAFDFATADVTICYDRLKLFELKDAKGGYSNVNRISLYQHDGTADGKWKRVASLSAQDAEADGYRISGTLSAVSGAYNLGWFAVMAEKRNGLTFLVQ